MQITTHLPVAHFDVMPARETHAGALPSAFSRSRATVVAGVRRTSDQGGDRNCRAECSCRRAAAEVDPLKWRIWRFPQHSTLGLSIRSFRREYLVDSDVRTSAAKGCEHRNRDRRCRG
jgi:hypothetical protein